MTARRFHPTHTHKNKLQHFRHLLSVSHLSISPLHFVSYSLFSAPLSFCLWFSSLNFSSLWSTSLLYFSVLSSTLIFSFHWSSFLYFSSLFHLSTFLCFLIRFLFSSFWFSSLLVFRNLVRTRTINQSDEWSEKSTIVYCNSFVLGFFVPLQRSFAALREAHLLF